MTSLRLKEKIMAKKNLNDIFFKLYIPLLLIATFSFWELNGAPNYYYYPGISYSELESLGEIEEFAKSEKIEVFLKKQVPGLSVSYRGLIDVLIEEGCHVYLRGGVVRDVLSFSKIEPNDVDLDYTGKVDQLIAICQKYHWQFTHFPGRKIVTIGDPLKGGIDAMPMRWDEKTDNESMLEFTINNIFYHCNTRSFTKSSEAGLKDLTYDRINILTENWKAWLYQGGIHPYYKVFRFWKMVGKGYVFSQRLQDFFIEETKLIMNNDPKGWENDLFEHLSSHFFAYDDIFHGAIAIMGYDWTEEHLSAHKEKMEHLYYKILREKEQNTYNF